MSSGLAITLGIACALVLIGIGQFLVGSAIGQDVLKVMARFVAAFLLKLGLALVAMAAMAWYAREQLFPFAVSLMAVFLPLLLLQLVLYTRKLKQAESGNPHA